MGKKGAQKQKKEVSTTPTKGGEEDLHQKMLEQLGLKVDSREGKEILAELKKKSSGQKQE